MSSSAPTWASTDVYFRSLTSLSPISVRPYFSDGYVLSALRSAGCYFSDHFFPSRKILEMGMKWFRKTDKASGQKPCFHTHRVSLQWYTYVEFLEEFFGGQNYFFVCDPHEALQNLIIFYQISLNLWGLGCLLHDNVVNSTATALCCAPVAYWSKPHVVAIQKSANFWL